jgi:hypothetical protein
MDPRLPVAGCQLPAAGTSSRSGKSSGSSSHGSEAVATSSWEPRTRWTRVEPLRGSDSKRIGVVANARPV